MWNDIFTPDGSHFDLRSFLLKYTLVSIHLQNLSLYGIAVKSVRKS